MFSIRSVYITQHFPSAIQLMPCPSKCTLLVCVLNRGKQKDYRWDKKQGSDVYCWFIHNSGKGFIDGHYTSYIVPTLDSFLPPV